MTWHLVRRSRFVGVLIASCGAGTLSAQALESIVANDNRVPGGELRDGVLILRLDLRRGV